jgi:hypothetical protein
VKKGWCLPEAGVSRGYRQGKIALLRDLRHGWPLDVRPAFACPQYLAAQALPSPVIDPEGQLPRCQKAGTHANPNRVIGREASRKTTLMQSLEETPVPVDGGEELLDLGRRKVHGVHVRTYTEHGRAGVYRKRPLMLGR